MIGMAVQLLIGFFIGQMLSLFFTTDAFDTFKEYVYFFVHQIRARFFPSEFEKRVSGLLDDIEESTALAEEIIRLRSNNSKLAAGIHAENVNDTSGGGAAVEFKPGAEAV